MCRIWRLLSIPTSVHLPSAKLSKKMQPSLTSKPTSNTTGLEEASKGSPLSNIKSPMTPSPLAYHGMLTFQRHSGTINTEWLPRWIKLRLLTAKAMICRLTLSPWKTPATISSHHQLWLKGLTLATLVPLKKIRSWQLFLICSRQSINSSNRWETGWMKMPKHKK